MRRVGRVARAFNVPGFEKLLPVLSLRVTPRRLNAGAVAVEDAEAVRCGRAGTAVAASSTAEEDEVPGIEPIVGDTKVKEVERSSVFSCSSDATCRTKGRQKPCCQLVVFAIGRQAASRKLTSAFNLSFSSYSFPTLESSDS